jgi:protein subunit release factor B
MGATIERALRPPCQPFERRASWWQAWESVVRVLHLAAGIDVEPQKKTYDSFARADLWLVGTRRIHEYDGNLHRERQVHRNDLARDWRLIEIDWQRMGYTSPSYSTKAPRLSLARTG